MNIQTGTFMDVASGSGTASDVPVICNRNVNGVEVTTQSWNIASTVNTVAYVIQNAASIGTTNQFIDLFDGGQVDGTALNVWSGDAYSGSRSTTTNTHQLWYIVPAA